MIIPKQDEFTGARVQALSMTVGLFTFVSIGIAACIALVAGLFYLVVSFVLLVLRAVAEAFSGIAAIWVNADSLLKLIILVAIAYSGYYFYQSRVARKKGGAYA